MIEFRCPSCDKQIVVEDGLTGQKHSCACGNVCVVPDAPRPEPEPEPEPAAEADSPPAAAPKPGPVAAPQSAEETKQVIEDGSAQTIYEGSPSQLENLSIMFGLVLVGLVAFLALPMLVRDVFKASSGKWGWIIAAAIVVVYALWLGYRMLRLSCTHYTVTTENILVEQGILVKDTDNIDLFRVVDVNIRRSLAQRALGIGTVLIQSSDKSMPEATLKNIPEPKVAFEKIRKAAREAAKERGVMQVKY
jgi:membrane protein YdbS with pleckstrin-like domain